MPKSASSPKLPEELRKRYRFLRRIGAGGQGQVLAVHDQELGRDCALKIIPIGTNPGDVERFLREIRILATVDHPNILRVYQAGQWEQTAWLLTELLDGETLEHGCLDTDVVDVILQLGSALERLHQSGVYHRDVKPANALLTRDGRAVLLDFGLARDPKSEVLTQTGILVGTPAYLAPEIYSGSPYSAASDWFALGVTLYFLLEGHAPYNPAALMGSSAHGTLPPLQWEKHLSSSAPARLAQALLSAPPCERPLRVESARSLLTPAHIPPVEPAVPLSMRRRYLLATKVLGIIALVWLLSFTVTSKVATKPSLRRPEPLPLTKVVAPSPKLVALAERLSRFFPEPGLHHKSELHLARIIPMLQDDETAVLWFEYLEVLEEWLRDLTKSANTPEEADLLLSAPVVQKSFRRFAVDVPSGFLDSVGETIEKITDIFWREKTPELRSVLRNRALVFHEVATSFNRIRDATHDWTTQLAPGVRRTASMTLAVWWWQRMLDSFDLESSRLQLFRRLLPQATSSPYRDWILASCIDFLRRVRTLRLMSCDLQRKHLREILAVLTSKSAPTNQSPAHWHNLGLLVSRSKRCSPSLTMEDIDRLSRAAEVSPERVWHGRIRSSRPASAVAP